MTCAYPGECQISTTTRNGTPLTYSNGYCEVHWGRFRRTGKFGPPDSLHQGTTRLRKRVLVGEDWVRPECDHPDGCVRFQAAGSDYCGMHSFRMKRHGELGPVYPYPGRRNSDLPRDWTPADGPCLHPDGCEIENPPRFIDGLCAVHWQRRYNTGEVGPAAYINKRQSGCAYPDGCEIETDVFTKGYCQHHAMRLKNSGTLGPPGLVEAWGHLADLETSVYQCFDATNRPLYVGVAARLNARLNQHRLHATWWPDVRLVTSFTEPTRRDALDTERATIKDLSPIHNVVHNG